MHPLRPKSWQRLVFLAPVLVLASAAAFAAGSDFQSRGPRASRDTLPPVLLKRLAAAVDGYRTGQVVWVVVSMEAPYDVDMLVTSLEVANRRRATLGGSYEVLGPYQGTTDFNLQQPPGFMPLCHDWDSDPCNEEYAMPPTAWAYQRIDSIVVTAHRGSDVWRARFRRGGVDALFFTLAAADKFYFPYLVSVYGMAYADSVRSSFRTYVGEVR